MEPLYLSGFICQDGDPDSVESPPTDWSPARPRHPRTSGSQSRTSRLERLLHRTSQCHCGNKIRSVIKLID